MRYALCGLQQSHAYIQEMHQLVCNLLVSQKAYAISEPVGIRQAPNYTAKHSNDLSLMGQVKSEYVIGPNRKLQVRCEKQAVRSKLGNQHGTLTCDDNAVRYAMNGQFGEKRILQLQPLLTSPDWGFQQRHGIYTFIGLDFIYSLLNTKKCYKTYH
jgi:hypothetical protein